MPKVSNYTRTRIELHHKQGLYPAGIFRSLKSEGLLVCLASVSQIIKKLQITGSVANLPRSGRPAKLSVDAKAFIDQQMQKNEETKSQQIQKKLAKQGITVSSSIVQRSRQQQGWTLQQSTYCQLIKRLEYARHGLDSGDTFHSVIFTDECSISLQHYRHTCYRKIGEAETEASSQSSCLSWNYQTWFHRDLYL